MRKKILLIILVLLILVLFLRANYNQKLNTEEYISLELYSHYAALTQIVYDIGTYTNNDTYNIDEFNISRLLYASRNFELALNSYENALSKSKVPKEAVYSRGSIMSLLNNYYDFFVDSVSVINEIDYDTLNIVKNDLEKWFLWIEENYITTDKDGYYVNEMYTYEDMVESGLIDELVLGDYQSIERLR